MTRERIIALLIANGVTVNGDESDEQLASMLESHFTGSVTVGPIGERIGTDAEIAKNSIESILENWRAGK